ncbi:MAG: TatD family hydrolase [Pseudanabaenaceae cyanobacterium bins.39]|nr:TatD family hydrolase [Pseudanabaenaceae cyanobacterium bins.39]
MFIDFHTHHDRQASQLLNLRSVHLTSKLQPSDLPPYCSLGLHPWFIEPLAWQRDMESLLENLQLLAQLPQVIAIGECGLDRQVNLPMSLQLQIFQRQIILAEQLRKPLVIHCVRAFSELIFLKKKLQKEGIGSVPWIIHGFHRKAEVFNQMLDHDFYFSLGAAILNDRAFVSQAIATMPQGRFLLETDDRQDITIEQIYTRAAHLRQVPIATLQSQLIETYTQLTGRRI